MPKSFHADIVLITHNHFDHHSLEDLQKISSGYTIIITAKECLDQVNKISSKEKIGLLPGDERMIISDIKIKAVHAYNLDKIKPDTNKPFHPKEDKKIGFLSIYLVHRFIIKEIPILC